MIEYWLLTPTPAIPSSSILAGDKFPVDPGTHQATHMRGSTVIGTHSTNWPGLNLGDTPAVQPMDGIYRIVYAKEIHMAGISLALTGASINEAGHVTINYGDSTSTEHELADLTQEANEFDQDGMLAKKILRVALITEQPTLNDPHALDGMSVAVDRNASQPIILSRP